MSGCGDQKIIKAVVVDIARRRHNRARSIGSRIADDFERGGIELHVDFANIAAVCVRPKARRADCNISCRAAIHVEPGSNGRSVEFAFGISCE